MINVSVVVSTTLLTENGFWNVVNFHFKPIRTFRKWLQNVNIINSNAYNCLETKANEILQSKPL